MEIKTHYFGLSNLALVLNHKVKPGSTSIIVYRHEGHGFMVFSLKMRPSGLREMLKKKFT